MSVHRVSRNQLYKTVHLKGCEDDPRLSWKAVGILWFLLSRPEDWQIYQRDLLKRHTDGLASLRTGLKELEEAGYLKRRFLRGEDGKLTGRDWLVSERPLEPGDWEEIFGE